MDIVLYCLIALLVFCGWFMYANNKTLKVRLEVLDIMMADEKYGWSELDDEYDQTSYGRDMWRLIILQDPVKYYPDRLREVVMEKRKK